MWGFYCKGCGQREHRRDGRLDSARGYQLVPLGSFSSWWVNSTSSKYKHVTEANQWDLNIEISPGLSPHGHRLRGFCLKRTPQSGLMVDSNFVCVAFMSVVQPPWPLAPSQ